MSSTDVFAEPMLDGDEYLEKYRKQLTKLGEKGLLPKLDATLTYKAEAISEHTNRSFLPQLISTS